MKKQPIPGAHLSAEQIAEITKGDLIGDPGRIATELCAFDEHVPSSCSFSSQKHPQKLADAIAKSEIAVLLISKSVDTADLPPSVSYVAVDNPLRRFIDLVPSFYQEYARSPGIHPSAVIHPTVKLGSNVEIGPFVTIAEGCSIGDNTILFSHVVVYPECTIGSGCVLHSHAVVRERCTIGDGVIIQNGSVVGGDGFGYIPDPREGIKAVPQVGRAIIRDHVEIGVNSCIDRGAFGDTTVGMSTKIDNLVQVGHNVTIGKYGIICSQVAIAGSVKLGNQVTLGGGGKVNGHIKICDNVRVAGNGTPTSNITKPGDYGGFPAQPIGVWRREIASLRKLPSIVTRLRQRGILEESSEGEAEDPEK
jgi:UDP-3-O-[3-hydroxymyristoyl] glucosamine N-acyltransferase